jgi:hypothetical protein
MTTHSAEGGGRLRRPAYGVAVALLALAATSQSRADDQLGYDLLAGIGETDNVRLTPTDRRSDTIATVGFDLDWQEQRSLLDANVIGDMEYLDFLRHSYSPEVIGNLLANMQLNLVPQFLRWEFNDNFGQGNIDPAAPLTPNNRENINYFTTGPDLTMPLGAANEMLLEGRYSNVNYEVSPLSSNRYSAGLGIRHELSSSSGISVNVQDEVIRFEDSTLNPDYDEQEAYLRYDAKGVRTRITFDVGVDRLKLTNETVSGPLARVEVTRQLSPSTSIVLTAGRDFSDVGNEFLLLQSLGGATLSTQAVGASGDPFKQDYVTLGWNFQERRTTFGFGAGYFKLTYEDGDTLDEERTTGSAHFSRRLTPRVEAGVYVSYVKEQFRNLLGGDYNELDATAQVTYRINSKFSMDVELARTRREDELDANSYTDDRVWLKFRYGRALPPAKPAIVPNLPAFPGQPRY